MSLMQFLPINPVMRAGLFMVLAMAAFVCNDTCVKIVGSTLPVGELVAVRGLMSSLIIMLIAGRHGALNHVAHIASRPVVIRATLDLIATLLFITALVHMELANLTAIMQAVPLAVALLSSLFLGERVGIRRTLAIVVGFAGVILIARPDPAHLSRFDVLALSIVFAVAVRDIVTKRIPAKVPTLVVALANAGFVTAGGVLVGLFEGFVMPQAWQFAILALASVFLSLGYMFMVATLRTGDLSATAPFRYSVMVFAILSGIIVFHEFPDPLAAVGMALIVGAGLYAAHREWLLRDNARTQSP